MIKKCETNNYTVSFDEQVKGWTSFHSYKPDYMIGMNNQFFSFLGADLYIHHSDNVERNNYYGVTYPSKLSMIFNDHPSDVKELKALSIEGNNTWETVIKSFVSNSDDYLQSTIKEGEFVKKEGMYYAYARRNEDIKQTDSKSIYGVGVVENISGNTMIVNGYNDTMVQGDLLVRGQDMSIKGEIVSVTRLGNKTEITLNDTTGIDIGDFICGMKDPRIEGGNLRGYSIRVDLETTKKNKVEVFAVNIEVFKSFQ